MYEKWIRFVCDFLQEMSASDANDLIGQFGVGFYSSFLGKYEVLGVCPFGSTTSKT